MTDELSGSCFCGAVGITVSAIRELRFLRIGQRPVHVGAENLDAFHRRLQQDALGNRRITFADQPKFTVNSLCS